MKNLTLHVQCRGWVSLCLRILCVLRLASCCLPTAAQNLNAIGNLSFGTFVATSAGTVAVAPDGSRAQTGGVFVLNQGGLAAAAQFSVHGKANATYAITLPADNTVAMSDGKGHSMTVKAFTSNLSGLNILSKNGNGQFNIGATLNVAASQARGSYTGTFAVIVNYQ